MRHHRDTARRVAAERKSNDDRSIQRSRRQRAHLSGLGSHCYRDHGLRLPGREIRFVPGDRRSDARAAALSVGGQTLGNVAGLILIGLGAVMIILALVRFRRTGREIDSAERIAGSGERLDLALPALLTLIGVALFAYLSYTVISRF